VLWIWFLLSVVARGQAVDVASASAMVRDLVPEVERRAGRAFVRVPEIAIDTRAGLRARLLQPPVRLVFAANLGKTDEPPEPPPEHVERVDHLVTHAMAVYVGREEKIYLVGNTIRDIGRSLQLKGETLRPLLRCVLVHELVHALQHQYGVHDVGDADLVRGRSALKEGHATYVADQYCEDVEGPAMTRLLDVIQGLELEASLPADGGSAVYSWGRRLVRALIDEGLVWSAMVSPAPSWSAIVDAIRPTHPPAWRSAAPLRTAIERLDRGTEELPEAAPASPTTLLTSYFWGDLGRFEMPRALAGFVLEGEAGDEDLLLATFLLEQPGAPEDLVKLRRAHVLQARQRGVPLMVYEKASGMLARTPKAKLRDVGLPGVLSTLRVRARTTGDGPYQEYWFATERRLVFFASSGQKMRERDIVASIGGLLSEMSGDLGAPLDPGAMGDWVQSVREVDPKISRHPSWSYLLDRVSHRVARGERGACLSVFDRPLRDETIPDRVPYARSAFSCAAVAGDVTLAQRALPFLSEAEPFAAVSLAAQLVNDRRPREALAMLDKADVDGTESLELIRAATEIRISAAVRLRRWNSVSRALDANPDLDPHLQAYAGSALFLAGRRPEGRRILKRACPKLPSGDQEPCWALLSSR